MNLSVGVVAHRRHRGSNVQGLHPILIGFWGKGTHVQKNLIYRAFYSFAPYPFPFNRAVLGLHQLISTSATQA